MSCPLFTGQRLRSSLAALVATMGMAGAWPAVAPAADYLLRPTGTLSHDGPGLVHPPKADAAAVLAKPVLAPATPDTGTYVSGPRGSQLVVAVAAAPALRSGEQLRGVTVWAYVQPGARSGVTLSLLSASTTLATRGVAAGAPRGWYALTTASPPDAAELSHLAIGLQASGSAAGADGDGRAEPRGYAAYLDVLTADPPSPPSSSGSGAPGPLGAPGGPLLSGSLPAESGGPPGGSAPRLLSGTPTLAGGLRHHRPARRAGRRPGRRVSTGASIPWQALVVDHVTHSVNVTVTCAALARQGCHGELLLRASGVARRRGASRHPQAVIASCGGTCTLLGSIAFQAAPNARLQLHLHIGRSLGSLFGSHRSVRVYATVVTRSAHRRLQASTFGLSLHQGSPPRR